MRILQVCAAYKPAYVYGGPTMSVSMLSESLVRSGVQAEVYATTANGKEELPVASGEIVNVDGVNVTYFRRLTKDHTHYSPALFTRLKNEAKNFDLVHIHAWWNLVSLFSCHIALRRGVPVLLSPRGTLSGYSFHNKSAGMKWLLHQLLGKRLLKKCFIHATTPHEADSLLRLYQPRRVFVIPNFVKLPERQTRVIDDNPPIFRLLFFSRIEEKKGLGLLLKALPAITAPFRLTVAGNGDDAYIASLKELAASLGIAEKVDWIGFQNENKFEVLRQHDLFILPSYDENFGNAVIESLAVGTPVLISEGVGLASYVAEKELGWICHNNAESIAWEINNIFANQQGELENIRHKAPDIIYTDFENDNLVAAYVDMYKQLTGHE